MDSLHVLVCMRTCNSTNVFVLSAGERIEADVSSARHKQNTWQNLMQHQVCTPDRRHQVRKTWTGPVAGMDGVRGPDAVRCRRSVRCLWRSGRRSTCSWRRTCGRRQWLPLTHPPGALNGSSCSIIAAAEATSAAEVAASLVHLSFWRAC